MRLSWTAGLVSCAAAVALTMPLAPGAMAGLAVADVEGFSCAGEDATIVGSPDVSPLEGTPGRDVIVTNGSDETYARDGDDLVCVSEGANPDAFAILDAGDGGDDVRVTSTNAMSTTRVCLGDGADQFTGGPGVDVLVSDPFSCDDEEGFESPDDSGFSLPEEEARDTIRTLGGGDYVEVGVGRQSADTVDTGVGNDLIVFEAYTLASAASLDGGPGTDTVKLAATEASGNHRSDRWELHNETPSAGYATLNGVRALRWGGLEQFYLSNDVALYTFTGSARPEQVVSRFLVRARMGAGNDEVQVSKTGRARTRQVDLVGGPGADSFRVNGCGGSVEGGRGAEKMWIFRAGPCQGSRPFVLSGGPGDDRMGATQVDTINGGAGRDRCQGTRRNSMCEY